MFTKHTFSTANSRINYPKNTGAQQMTFLNHPDLHWVKNPRNLKKYGQEAILFL